MRPLFKCLSLFVVAGVCLSTQCLAQTNSRPVIDGLVGPVRSLKDWDVSINGQRRLSSSETYDQNGNLITYTVYKDEGGILYSDTNTYNAAGRLVEKHTAHSEYVYLPDKQVHIYNELGQKVEVKGFSADGSQLGGYLYLYDSQGNLIEDRSYPLGKNLVYSNRHLTRRAYDAKGNLISRQQYVYDGNGARPDEFGMGYQKQVYLNDKNGRPTLIGYLKADNRLLRTETTKYDARGNTLEDTERGADGRVLSKVSYSYVFDRHGNWIKQVRRQWTAEGVGSVFGPLEVSIRSIVYYSRPYKRKEK